MGLARKLIVAVMAVAASVGGPAATAAAATSAPAVPVASCDWTAPLGTDTYDGVKFWLSYNPCTRQARGAILLKSLPVFNYYWVVWVYNQNTGDESENWPESAGNTYTTPIGDAGTKSHVCIQQLADGSTVAYGPKACTGYY